LGGAFSSLLNVVLQTIVQDAAAIPGVVIADAEQRF
jgi:hypothetical protein